VHVQGFGLKTSAALCMRLTNSPATLGRRFAVIYKILERQGTAGAIALGVVFLYIACCAAYWGVTNKDGGWVPAHEICNYSDQCNDVPGEYLQHDEYRDECYAGAATLFLVGGFFLIKGISAWRKRDELETSWKQISDNPDNLEEIRRNPQNYRDDFLQWLKMNRLI